MNHKGLFFTVLSSALLGCLYFFAQGYLAYREYIIFQELYDVKEYNTILELYEDNDSDLWLHNKGNASFGEYEISQDVSLLEQSVLYFSGSLAISENDDTRFNYEYTSGLLERGDTDQGEDDISNQNDEFSQDEDSGEQQQDIAGSGATTDEDNELSEDGVPGEQQQDIAGSGAATDEDNGLSQDGVPGEEQQDNTGSGFTIDEDESEQFGLSPAEKAIIDQQTQQLKRDQIYNQKYFGTQNQQGNEISDVFESFFGSVDRGGEKDW